VRAVPRLCEFYPGICLTTEEKARKNLSQGKKTLSEVNKNLSVYSIHITKTPTQTHTHIAETTKEKQPELETKHAAPCNVVVKLTSIHL